MEGLANVVIATAELVEAEGRALRQEVVRFLWAAMLIVIAALMGLAGFSFILIGLYWLLLQQFSTPVAALTFGFVALVLAGVLAWIARDSIR
jgi:hypothetical protein